jgi:hypothetical protein
MGEIIFLQDYLDRVGLPRCKAAATSSGPPVPSLAQACRAMSDGVRRMRAAAQQITSAAADLRDMARGDS